MCFSLPLIFIVKKILLFPSISQQIMTLQLKKKCLKTNFTNHLLRKLKLEDNKKNMFSSHLEIDSLRQTK